MPADHLLTACAPPFLSGPGTPWPEQVEGHLQTLALTGAVVSLPPD